MQLTGLEFTSSVRLTQANNALDIDVDLLSTSSKIDPNFYSMLFFDMLNGDVTGADGGSVTTGFLCKVYDTAGNLYATTTVQKLDWYQVEKGYISEAPVCFPDNTSSRMLFWLSGSCFCRLFFC